MHSYVIKTPIYEHCTYLQQASIFKESSSGSIGQQNESPDVKFNFLSNTAAT